MDIGNLKGSKDAGRAGLRRFLLPGAALSIAYVVGYLGYRQTHLERWDRDGREYVIFGSRANYYAFRPLRYLDRAATGVGTHIGPHR